MRRFALPLIILGCVALAAALTWVALTNSFARGARTEPAGSAAPAVTQSLPPFERIDVSGMADVELVQGSGHAVRMPAASTRDRTVTAEVRDGTLFIESRDVDHWWDFFVASGSRAPEIVVTFEKIQSIDASGTVRLSAARLTADALRIEGAGGTSVKVDDLAAQELTLIGAGALRAEVSGKVVAQDIDISGAGNYRGARLASQRAKVSVAGAGKVVINAEKSLDATISGAGSVEYIGDPKVTEDVSGVGRVKRRDAETSSRMIVA